MSPGHRRRSTWRTGRYPRFTRSGRVRSLNRIRWRPASSKFAGSSHVSNACASCRPFAVDGRVPGRVAVSALVDRGLPEDSLVREAQPLRGGARRGVERVALPFVAPIPEAERALHHQVHRFGRSTRPLKERREVHVAHFDRIRPPARSACKPRHPPPGRSRRRSPRGTADPRPGTSSSATGGSRPRSGTDRTADRSRSGRRYPASWRREGPRQSARRSVRPGSSGPASARAAGAWAVPTPAAPRQSADRGGLHLLRSHGHPPPPPRDRVERAPNCGQTHVHIVGCRRPGRHADPHGRAAVPLGSAAPAGAVLLHARR